MDLDPHNKSLFCKVVVGHCLETEKSGVWACLLETTETSMGKMKCGSRRGASYR